MAERIIAVRHFQEQDNLLYLNDSPVMETELPKAISVASEISDRAKEGGFSQIHILTSSKKRTEVTAVEVAKEIGTTFPVTIRIDGRIRTIDQGKYILPEGYKPGDYFQPLQDAWAIFLEETFGEGNLWYRFGDPVTNVDGTCKYPQLVGHFDKYGENQIEFSLRFYSFLVDLCREYKDQKDVLPVVVIHQALVARFAEITKIAGKVKLGLLAEVSRGRLPLLEWDQFEEIRSAGDVFSEFGGVTTFPMTDLYDFVDVLVSEVDYLQRLLDERK